MYEFLRALSLVAVLVLGMVWSSVNDRQYTPQQTLHHLAGGSGR